LIEKELSRNQDESKSKSSVTNMELPMRCITENLNVRSSPSLNSKVVEHININDYVSFTGNKLDQVTSGSRLWIITILFKIEID